MTAKKAKNPKKGKGRKRGADVVSGSSPTVLPPARESCQCFLWDARCSTQLQQDTLWKALKGLAKKFAFQHEKGESGYEHYQIKMSLFKKTTKHPLLSLFAESGVVLNYLAPSASPSFTYVMKTDTRLDGPWTEKDEPKWIDPEYDIPYEQLRRWQQQLFDLPQERRIIHYVSDVHGNIGKSFFKSWMTSHDHAISLPAISNYKELVQIAHGIISNLKNPRDPKCVIIDLERNHKPRGEFWNAIEAIKNGSAFDARYGYREIKFLPPKVIVFSNNSPPTNMLSNDRWRFWSVVDSELIQTTVDGQYIVENSGVEF